MTASRRTLWIAFVLGLAGFGALAHHFWFACDDGFISFRYAKNLAEGNGLIFNPGEDPPVEGYSNFLWTLLLALCYALGAEGSALPTVANVISLASASALLLLVTRTAQRRLELGGIATGATAIFLGTLAPFALWATGGLETMPFALSLFATYERLLGDPEHPRGVQAGLCALAAGLLRADGALWVAVVIGLAGITWLARRRPDLLRATLVTAAIAAVGVAAHVLWRHSYYGDWLPNTAHVKIGFAGLRLERGLNYVVTFLLTVPAFALLPMGALALRGGRAPDLALQAIGVVLFAILYAIYVGGDFMPMGRLLVPAVPFIGLLFALVFRSVEPMKLALPFAGVLVATGILLGTNVLRWRQELLQRFHFRWNSEFALSEYEQWMFLKAHAEKCSLVGRGLARYAAPGESLIRGAVGAVGYYTDLFVFDQNGLVTPEVSRRDAPLARLSAGHDQHVAPDFFFARRPTYVAATVTEIDADPLTDFTPEVIQIMRRGIVRMERRALPPDDGFPPGLELRVLRLPGL